MLTTVMWSPPANDPSPVWVYATSGPHDDWVIVFNGQPTNQQVYWTNGDIAQFPVNSQTNSPFSALNLQTIPISSTVNDLVFAQEIEFDAGSFYNFTTTGLGTPDQLTLDPTGGTDIVADQVNPSSSPPSNGLPTIVTFSTQIVNYGTQNSPLTISAGADGSGRVGLAAANAYTGETTVEAGAELDIGGGASGGSIQSENIDNEGLLRFWSNSFVSFAGQISGSGTVSQYPGTATLTGKASIFVLAA